MAIDTHGLTMEGIKDVCGKTRLLRGEYKGDYLQIWYLPKTKSDIASGWVMTRKVRHGETPDMRPILPGAYYVTDAAAPMSMQEIANCIYAEHLRREAAKKARTALEYYEGGKK